MSAGSLSSMVQSDACVRTGADENQRLRSLRSCCGKGHCGGTAFADPHEGGFLEADSIHDGLDLRSSIVERANFRDRIRQSDPCLVEHDDPTERGEPIHERLVLGQRPEQLDMADEGPGVNQLDLPVAEHLIREAEVAAGRVRRFRHVIERN